MAHVLLEQWKQRLKQHLPIPAGALIRQRIDVNTGNLIICIDWYLRTDANRPRKRSRLIKICVARDIINAYLKTTPEMRIKMENKIIKYLKKQLANFDPEHVTPKGGLIPQVEWSVDKKIL